MDPIVYKSTDASAPVLTGQAGSLIALLDACLVTGYGSQAAAGWTKAFSGTNQAAYRWPGGKQWYWDVNDNAPTLGGAREARTALYETMSAVSAGGSKVPTSSTYIIVRKSATLDATARPWIVIADDCTVYVFIRANDWVGVYYGTHVGQFVSVNPIDPWPAAIFGRTSENSSSASNEDFGSCQQVVNTNSGHYFFKSFAGTVGTTMGKAGDTARGASVDLRGNLPYPNPFDLKVYISPIFLHTSNSELRGRLRGLWQLLNTAAGVTDGQMFGAAGDCYEGREFMAVQAVMGFSNMCTVLLETTAWDTE